MIVTCTCLALPAVAEEPRPVDAGPGAVCTLDPGSVSAAGQTVHLPTVSYPCP